MLKKPEVYIFISRFPPPFGGVSNQVKYLAEYACNNSDMPISIFVIDLKTLGLHHFTDGEWKSKYLYRQIYFYWCVIASLVPSLIRAILDKDFSLKFDKFTIWRLMLLLLSQAMSQYLKKNYVSLIYSFHLGGPSLLGGWLSQSFKAKHLTAVFGESFSNYEKLSAQKRLILTLVDEVVSCSDHCGKMMRILDEDINYSILYYGSDLKQLEQKHSVKSKKIKYDNKKTIMFLGRLNPEMGIIYFIELIQALEDNSPDNFKFVICGQEDIEYSKVKDFQKSFTGQLAVEISVSFERRNLLLLEADVLVVPSTNERACFGLAITEGIAAGCLVYARDVGGHIEPLLGDRRFLFDKNLPPEKLANRLTQDLSDNLVKEGLVSLRKKVVDKFDIIECMNQQLSYIDKTKARRRPLDQQ